MQRSKASIIKIKEDLEHKLGEATRIIKMINYKKKKKNWKNLELKTGLIQSNKKGFDKNKPNVIVRKKNFKT